MATTTLKTNRGDSLHDILPWGAGSQVDVVLTVDVTLTKDQINNALTRLRDRVLELDAPPQG